MTDILEGVRILDFSQEIQGPWGTAILADMGAEVIKVERRVSGELGRGAARTPDGVSPYFTVFNRGKKGMTFDLKKPEAIAILRRLAGTCDVVVNNWRVGVLDRLGLGYEDLRRERPDIIYVSATTFGPKGSMATKPGRDTLGQAYGGLMAVTGPVDGPPMPAGSLVADHSSAMVEAMGILAALLYRQKTGHGQSVDISLLATVMAMQAYEITRQALTPEMPIARADRVGLRGGGPWGAYRTADGWICMAGTQGETFDRFCEILGVPHVPTDPRFATREERVKHFDALQAIFDEAFLKKTTAQWLEPMEAAELLVSPINNYRDVVQSEQVAANGYLQPTPHPVAGTLQVVGVPIKMSEARIEPRGPAPELGQHNEELLLSLGYSWEEIARFRDDEVI